MPPELGWLKWWAIYMVATNGIGLVCVLAYGLYRKWRGYRLPLSEALWWWSNSAIAPFILLGRAAQFVLELPVRAVRWLLRVTDIFTD
jgi:hypothetical protein